MGWKWQFSIGADVKATQLVAGQKIVNGKVQTGPFVHVTKSVLREVSVVAVGADASTKMKLAARFTLYGGTDMDFEKWLKDHGINAAAVTAEQKVKLQAAFDAKQEPPTDIVAALKPEPAAKPAVPAAKLPVVDLPVVMPAGSTISAVVPDVKAEAVAAVAAERKRIADIQALCAGEFVEIERQAISAGWSVAEASPKVLEAMRAARPKAPMIGGTVQADEAKTLEAAMCLRVGIEEKFVLATYGEPAIEAAQRDRHISLQELFVACARLEGKPISRTFGNDTIRAAFSTVTLPGILNSVANKRLLKAFTAQAPIAPRICAEGDLVDFKEAERYRLTDVGDLTPVAPDGELKHGGLTEEKATNQLDTYGKMFALTRQMIINDDLGAFIKVPDGMGARAARKIDQLFFTRLLSNPVQTDASALFSVAHANYMSGAASALDATSLAAAVQLFLDQVDADNQPINIAPKFLLVPTGLKMTAAELLNSTFLMSVGSTAKQRIPTYNALADDNLTPVVSPYMSNSAYTGYSTTAWYLFADPAIVDTFEIGYLRGQRTPTIEQTATDFNTLGIQFRVFFDLGVREQDTRGMVMSAGV